MRTRLLSGLSAIALVAGLGIAGAQQASPPDTPPQKQIQQQQEKAQHTEEGRAGTTEPASHAPSPPPEASEVFVNGRLIAPGAPADTQTVPAKFSERNAALDRLPTMAWPLQLTDEQKQRIRQAVSTSNAPVAGITLHPADQLPSSVAVSELPPEITKAVPAVTGYSYVRTKDGILLVRAPTMTVVGEVANK